MLEDGFADIIGKARFGKGWSLSDLSDRSKIAETRITALEEEAPPKPGEVTSLGSLLDLDVKKLQDSSDCTWEPNARPPYILDPDLTPSNDMVHNH